MNFKKVATVFVILAGIFFSGCVQAENYVGKTIDSVFENATVQYLTQDELVAVVSGKVLVGESIKTQRFGVYFKKRMNEDGTWSMKIYRKGGTRILKEITGGKWSVKDDGTLCSERDGVQNCNKKVCKVGDQYLNVLKKDGKIFASWSLEE